MERHLMLVEPDERLRGLLRRYLSRQGCLVTAARDVAHAERLLEGLDFDLIVAGAPTAGRLVREGRAPVLALAGGAAEAQAAEEAGVRQVVRRPLEPEALMATIEALLPRNEQPVQAELPLRLGAITFDRASCELRRAGERLPLTAAEARLMARLAEAAGRPVRREHLVERPGEADRPAQLRAVDVQITRLRRKLEPDPRNPRYILTVRGTGYMLAPDA
ncbi:MAG: DNA-binding response regulator [Alphaproteobacteria bacterium]|nr:MAG: DNA-binding response regulator [Alphaproteobacteria bacterium]